MTPTRRTAVVLGVAVAIGAALRGAGALLRPPWHDEYFTAWAASLPLGDLLAALRLDSGPPLPYLLPRLVAMLGVSPLAGARLVSVVAGALAVLVAARAARRAAGEEAALWCAGLVSLHPLAVAWSCEGRGYALLMLAAALSWERLESLRETDRGGGGLAFAVALGCWSHALGLVLAGAAAVAALTLRSRARQSALLGVAGGLAAQLPWLPVAMAQPAAATAWMGAAWSAASPLDRILAPLRLLPTAAAFGDSLDLPSAPIAVQVVAALLCLALLATARKAVRPVLLALLPAAGLSLLAWAGAPYLLAGRSEALYLIAFLGVLAASRLRPVPRRVALALLLTGAAATTGGALVAWARTPPTTEATIAAAIRQRLPSGGTVVVGGYWRLGLWYHLAQREGDYSLISVPAAAAAHPGWYDDGPASAARAEVADLGRRLVGGSEPVSRLAVVVTPGLVTARPLEALARRLGLQEALRTPAAVVWLPPPGQ